MGRRLIAVVALLLGAYLGARFAAAQDPGLPGGGPWYQRMFNAGTPLLPKGGTNWTGNGLMSCANGATTTDCSVPTGTATNNLWYWNGSAWAQLALSSDFAVTGGVLGVGTYPGQAPATVTTLNGALTASATSITVSSTTDYPTAGAILIENEAVSYTSTTGTTFEGCTRGAYGTRADAHLTGKSVSPYLFLGERVGTSPRLVMVGDTSPRARLGINTLAPIAAFDIGCNGSGGNGCSGASFGMHLDTPPSPTVSPGGVSGSCSTSTTYYYKIVGCSSFPGDASGGGCNGPTPPSAETSVATGASTSIDILFPTVDGIAAWTVYRSTTSGGPYARQTNVPTNRYVAITYNDKCTSTGSFTPPVVNAGNVTRISANAPSLLGGSNAALTIGCPFSDTSLNVCEEQSGGHALFFQSDGNIDINFARDNSGTFTNPAITAAGDLITGLYFRAFDGDTAGKGITHLSWPTAASITAYVDGTPSTDNMPGKICLGANLGAAATTETTCIDHTALLTHLGNLLLGANAAELRLKGTGTGYTALKSPLTSTSSYTFTLPADYGTSGQFLKTLGNGTTQWDTAGGGTVLHTLSWFFPGLPTAGDQAPVGMIPQGCTSCQLSAASIAIGTVAANNSVWNVKRCTTNCDGSAAATYTAVWSSDDTINNDKFNAKTSGSLTTTCSAGDLFKVALPTVGASTADYTVTLSFTCAQ